MAQGLSGDTVHYGGGSVRWPDTSICSQGQRDMNASTLLAFFFFFLFFFFFFSVQFQPIFRVYLLSSVKPLWKNPHRHTQTWVSTQTHPDMGLLDESRFPQIDNKDVLSQKRSHPAAVLRAKGPQAFLAQPSPVVSEHSVWL